MSMNEVLWVLPKARDFGDVENVAAEHSSPTSSFEVLSGNFHEI